MITQIKIQKETLKNIRLLNESALGSTKITIFESTINPKNGRYVSPTFNTKVPKYITLSKAIERVIHGKDPDSKDCIKEKINEIRKLSEILSKPIPEAEPKPIFNTDEEYEKWEDDQIFAGVITPLTKYKNAQNLKKELKQDLPNVIYGGVFGKRRIDGLQEHSGLMAIDFDGFNYNDDNELTETVIYKKLKSCPEVVTIFISPSGNGLKGLVRIPKCTAEEHTLYFKAFAHLYEFNKNWDDSTSDVSRVCFESYDPNPYINHKAIIFSPDIEELKKELDVISNTLSNTSQNHNKNNEVYFPITDDDEIIKILFKNYDNWNTSFIDGQKHTHTLYTSSMMYSKGVSQKKAADYFNENINCGKVPDVNINKIFEQSYKEKRFPYNPYENYSKKNEIKNKIRRNINEVIESGVLDDERISKLQNEITSEFWYTSGKKLRIDNDKFFKFLQNNGYHTYFLEKDGEVELVKVNQGIVTHVTCIHIKHFVINYLEENNYLDVKGYITGVRYFFQMAYLDALSPIEIHEVKDTKTEVYIPAKNGLYKITKNLKTFIKYTETKGYTWGKSIINRNIEIVDNDDNDFKTFIEKVSNGDTLPFMCALGYMISRYQDRRNAKVLILNDENFTTEARGGTGKGLFAQAYALIRKLWMIDGKSYSNNDQFAYSGVDEFTNAIFFDDVKANFSMSDLFTKITTGLTTQRKSIDKVVLDFKDSPKFMIATNYTLKGNDHSQARRQHNLVFSQFFGRNRDLGDYFGHQIFEDWDADQWNRFYNYVINCTQKFLEHGLVKQKSDKNHELRKFVADTAPEFYEWIDDEENVYRGMLISKVDAYNKFKNSYVDFQKWLTQRKFTEWTQKYAEYKGLIYDSQRTLGGSFSLTEKKISPTKGRLINLITANKRELEEEEKNEVKDNQDDWLEELMA